MCEGSRVGFNAVKKNESNRDYPIFQLVPQSLYGLSYPWSTQQKQIVGDATEKWMYQKEINWKARKPEIKLMEDEQEGRKEEMRKLQEMEENVTTIVWCGVWEENYIMKSSWKGGWGMLKD